MSRAAPRRASAACEEIVHGHDRIGPYCFFAPLYGFPGRDPWYDLNNNKGKRHRYIAGDLLTRIRADARACADRAAFYLCCSEQPIWL